MAVVHSLFARVEFQSTLYLLLRKSWTQRGRSSAQVSGIELVGTLFRGSIEKCERRGNAVGLRLGGGICGNHPARHLRNSPKFLLATAATRWASRFGFPRPGQPFQLILASIP